MAEIKQDPFIGQRFGDGGHLEVVGWDGKRNKHHQGAGGKVYTVKCHRCAENDPELFGDGIFMASKGNLAQGTLPCGCAKGHKWTEQQNLVRIARACRALNYEFLSYAEEYAGLKTLLTLRCIEHDVVVSTSSVDAFARNHSKNCPRCRADAIRAANQNDDQDVIRSFLNSGSYPHGTRFRRGRRNGNLQYWEYTCPVCSNDEYVKAKVCSGIFESAESSLKKGSYACRCSKRYLWTREQREYQVDKILQAENSDLKISGWVGEYKNINSVMLLSCPIHKDKEVSLTKFLLRDRRCVSCSKKGLDLSKPASVYVLRTAGKLSFTGFGISTDIGTRICTHKRNLKESETVIDEVEVFHTSGRVALEIERILKKSFERTPQNVEGFRTEATLVHLYNDVVAFVDERIAELENVMDIPAEPCRDNDDTRPEVDEQVLVELGFNLLKNYERDEDE